MKALFISNDTTIGTKGSGAFSRMRSYADTIGTLHVLVRGTKQEDIVDGSLTVHVVGVNRFFAPMRLSNEAKRLIRSEGIEVVSAQDPFEYGDVALKAVRGTSAKLHIQVHTDFLSPWFLRSGNARSPKASVPLLNRMRITLADRVLPQASGIRVVSHRVKDSLVKRYGERIVEPTVIPIAVSDVLPPPVPLPQLPFTFPLIFVGRLEPEKRVEDLINAIARVALAHPAIGLVIVGDGRERKSLEAYAKKLGVSERVVFLGERSDATGLMQSAKGYIQASAYEGYGRTLIEAALARIPIISTDVGIVGEVLRGYQEIFSVPVADPVNIAAGIVALLSDHQARELYVRAAEAAVKEHLLKYQNQPELIAEDLQKITNV